MELSIGSLTRQAAESHIQPAFDALRQAKPVTNTLSGVSRGLGFVKMLTDAFAPLAGLAGEQLQRQSLPVNEALARDDYRRAGGRPRGGPHSS